MTTVSSGNYFEGGSETLHGPDKVFDKVIISHQRFLPNERHIFRRNVSHGQYCLNSVYCINSVLKNIVHLIQDMY
jgi:hypothetical protein